MSTKKNCRKETVLWALGNSVSWISVMWPSVAPWILSISAHMQRERAEEKGPLKDNKAILASVNFLQLFAVVSALEASLWTGCLSPWQEDRSLSDLKEKRKTVLFTPEVKVTVWILFLLRELHLHFFIFFCFCLESWCLAWKRFH